MLGITDIAIILTGEITWLILLEICGHLHLPVTPYTNTIVAAAQMLPAPLSLLAVGTFYLNLLWRVADRSKGMGRNAEAAS